RQRPRYLVAAVTRAGQYLNIGCVTDLICPQQAIGLFYVKFCGEVVCRANAQAIAVIFEKRIFRVNDTGSKGEVANIRLLFNSDDVIDRLASVNQLILVGVDDRAENVGRTNTDSQASLEANTV